MSAARHSRYFVLRGEDRNTAPFRRLCRGRVTRRL